MPKKDDDNEEKPWTPDQPIPDDEGEAEAQRRHMLNRRLSYLNDEAEKASKGKKGKSGSGSGSSGSGWKWS